MEEATQFTSKRKKEFEDMLKRPVYTETKIRVKFPNNTVLEATFSPKETLKTVVDFVKVVRLRRLTPCNSILYSSWQTKTGITTFSFLLQYRK